MSETADPKLTAKTLLEIETMFRECQREIRNLRKQNEIMGAQLDIVETFRAALLGPRRGCSASEDICFAVDRLLKGLINHPVDKA